MRLLTIVLLLAGISLLGVSASSAASFAKGDCVIINTYLEVISGPDPAQPGRWLARSLRYGRLGTESSWDERLIQPTQCPGPAPTAVSCPAAEPDSDGRTDFEVAVRGAIRTEEANAMQSSTVIQFKQVVMGQTRNWTTPDEADFPQGDQSYGLVPVQADWISCDQDDAFMYKVERNRYLTCFLVAATQALECDVVSNVVPDQIIEKTAIKND